MVSYFSRVFHNKSKVSLMKSEDIGIDVGVGLEDEGDEMRKSLFDIIKEKQSKVHTPAKESQKTIERESKTESQKLAEKEILDSFMKNEERAKEDEVKVTREK